MKKKVGNMWYVYDKTGKKILGKHKTEESANEQLTAIEISKKKRGKK